MPLTSVASYLPTMRLFAAHWQQVNTVLNPSFLVVQGGYAEETLGEDISLLEDDILAIVPADNARQQAAGDRDLAKARLIERVKQFRAAIVSTLPDGGYARKLPKSPGVSDNQSRFLAPLDDMAQIWAAINALPATGAGSVSGFTPPLRLAGAYTLANFNTDREALRTLYANLNQALTQSRVLRGNRDVRLPGIRKRLGQYRQKVLATFGSDSALVRSLPALSPPPGSTPDAVVVSGAWDSATQKAVLTWQPSTNPELDSYSIRTAPGPTYRAAEESTVGSVAAGTNTFATAVGLAAPGSVVLLRVYVVLTTGNEKGSATVKVTRPTA